MAEKAKKPDQIEVPGLGTVDGEAADTYLLLHDALGEFIARTKDDGGHTERITEICQVLTSVSKTIERMWAVAHAPVAGGRELDAINGMVRELLNAKGTDASRDKAVNDTLLLCRGNLAASLIACQKARSLGFDAQIPPVPDARTDDPKAVAVWLGVKSATDSFNTVKASLMDRCRMQVQQERHHLCAYETQNSFPNADSDAVYLAGVVWRLQSWV